MGAEQKRPVDELETARAGLQTRAAAAIAQLGDAAQRLRMDDIAERLARVRRMLESDTFKVIVIGRFKTGKSTFLNALLANSAEGATEGFEAPLPMDDLPTTATLTSIRYADEPSVTMWAQDGRGEPWSLGRFRDQSIILADEEENQAFFGNVREFELGYPSRFCRAGVTLLDSPGVDEGPMRTEITRMEVARCDAAIMVFRSDVIAGQGEMQFALDVEEGGAKIFCVVNRQHGRVVDERLRAVAWNKIIPPLMDGPNYSVGADFAAHDVFFVDVLAALSGKLDGDADALARSGLDQFEARLSDFLMRERYLAHLQKFTSNADQLALAMREQIHERMEALKQDEATLEARHQDYLKRLSEIESRSARLPEIIEAYAREAEEALDAAVVARLLALRQDLPAVIDAAKLKTTANPIDLLKSVVSSKAASKEAAEICSAHIQEGLRTWSSAPAEKPGAAATIAPICEAMTAAISAEVASMQRDLGAVRFEMLGWRPTEEKEQPTDWDKRVFLAMAGLLVGDFGNVFSVGGTGERGLIGGFLGVTLAYVLSIAISATALPIMAPLILGGSILGSFLAGASGLERDLKKVALEKAVAALDATRAEVAASCARAARQAFSELEARVMGEVGSLIAQDRENVRSIMNANRRSQHEKAMMLADLEEDIAVIDEARGSLDQAIAGAKALT